MCSNHSLCLIWDTGFHTRFFVGGGGGGGGGEKPFWDSKRPSGWVWGILPLKKTTVLRLRWCVWQLS